MIYGILYYNHISLREPNRWIAVGSNPDACKVVRVYLVFYELSAPVLMDVDAPCLSVVNVALDYGRISTGFHFEPRDTIVMNLILFKVPLRKMQRQGNLQSVLTIRAVAK